MPRRDSVNAATSSSSARDPPLTSAERTPPPPPPLPLPPPSLGSSQEHQRRHRHRRGTGSSLASTGTDAPHEAEQPDVPDDTTYDIRVRTDEAEATCQHSEFPAHSSGTPESEAPAAYPRWRHSAPTPFFSATVTSGASRQPASPRESGSGTSPPIAVPQHRLSRTSLFSTPPQSSDVCALARSSSSRQTSPAERCVPGNYPQQRIQLGRLDRSPKHATQLSSSSVRGAFITPISPPIRACVLPIASVRTGTPSSHTLSPPPAPLASPQQPVPLQRITSRPRVLVASRTDTLGSLASSRNSSPAANLSIDHLTPVHDTGANDHSSPHPLGQRRAASLRHRQLKQSSSAADSALQPSPTNDADAAAMGQSFGGCTTQSSPKEASSHHTTPTDGHRGASRRTSKSTGAPGANEPVHRGPRQCGEAAASPTASGAEVDDAHWVFQRPPNNQRTFYFEEDNLEFSSQFDSGNLIQVERVGTYNYRMYTAMDCGNAPCQTNNRQWFHFSVRGASKGVVVTVCFVGMMHSGMFTYDWMPVMAVVPTRPQYTRVAGKAQVEALETMPETPGYPLLVHKSVAKDDADSDGGGDEDENDAEAAAAANNGGGVVFSISPTGKAGGAGKKKRRPKKKGIAMNLTFNFKIETEIPVTYTPPQGRLDTPAIYIASNHPYSYSTLQRHLVSWQEAARRSNATRAMSVQAPDRQTQSRSRSELSNPAEACGGNSPTTVQPGSNGSRAKRCVGSPNAADVAASHVTTPSGMYFHREVLCKSLEGRDVTLLTISDRSRMTMERAPLISAEDSLPHSSARGQTERPFSFSGKQYVVLTARVHPGECPASHLMHGCIELLMSSTDSRAAALRHNFVFCIVPMLNPDGVIRGHSRVDSNGTDLNRMYRDPSRKRHPAPYAVVALLRSLGNRVALFIDMHAHANKRGSFFYGNSMDGPNQIENLLYAKLVSLNTPYLDFRSCNFSEANMFAVGKSGKSKDSSSRVVVFTELGIVHGYTIEASPVMAEALNPIVVLPNHTADEADACLPTPPPVQHTPATFADTGRAMLLALLDLRGMNPSSRLPLTQFHSSRGLTLWLQRQLQIESAEMLFAQAFKTHGKAAHASTSESGNVLLAAVMRSITAEEYPEKISIKKARLLPRTTYSGVRDFVPVETAIALLSQTAPTGAPRSLLYCTGASGGASIGAPVAAGSPNGGASSKGGGSGGGGAPRRGTSPSTGGGGGGVGGGGGNRSPTAIPPAVIATRRRSKPALLPGDTTVET
ncbi:metallo-peptidase, Clan MC, Family M14 [Novymonas esmeraldas]|uniref:Cytosolic carboxypeptidase-like protein 5 n=1 Tax=Novymonas esmeraldas TaxID=1808958 RepID=A0AAW0ESS8_9TRYP